MKNFFYVLLTTIFLAGSFWAGSQYHSKIDKPASTANLVEIESDSSISDANAETSLKSSGAVKIIPEKQQIIGIRTGIAETKSVTRTLRLLGKVAPDESRIFKINAAVDGIIQEVSPITTGMFVRKGQSLSSFYSPDIYSAEQGFLIALSSDRYQSNLQVQVNESRLLFLGLSGQQIEELKKKKEIEESIALCAPADGFVLARKVSPDLRFQKGDELYRIVHLDRIWIFADVYQSDAACIKPHAPATLSYPQLNIQIKAKVSTVLPLFDNADRTLKVRFEAENPGFILKPDMFVDITLPVDMPSAIIVPADAVLDSGLKQTIFIDKGNGLFEPRRVETGWRADNQIEIKNGLEAGERIALSGTFLIDSESRLEMAAGGM